MSPDPCQEMQLLIQADLDGELQPAEAARVAAHLETCPACARLQQQLMALSGQLRERLPRHRAPEPLRATIRRRLAAQDPAARRRRWPLAAGALAAGLALFALLPGTGGPDATPDWIVAAHIRALQPDHLLDVVSSEQHTVKPWFAGRLPFAPPVRDLSAQGFPLAGARLDYLPGNTTATLVYRRRQHIIDLFIWPTGPEESAGPASGIREGYNFLRWTSGEMTFWAVSDLNARELAEFSSHWR